MDLKGITDSKKFWPTVKPLFSNKIKSAEYITLKENGKNISNDKKLARIFNELFVNVVPNLGMSIKAISKYKNHPSIISIKKFVENSDSSFSFQHVPEDKITKTIKMLDPKKGVHSNDIPSKLIKSLVVFSLIIYRYILILISASKTENTLKTFKKQKHDPVQKRW